MNLDQHFHISAKHLLGHDNHWSRQTFGILFLFLRFWKISGSLSEEVDQQWLRLVGHHRQDQDHDYDYHDHQDNQDQDHDHDHDDHDDHHDHHDHPHDDQKSGSVAQVCGSSGRTWSRSSNCGNQRRPLVVALIIILFSSRQMPVETLHWKLETAFSGWNWKSFNSINPKVQNWYSNTSPHTTPMIASRENHVMEISKKSPEVFERFPGPMGLESAAVVLKRHYHTFWI